MTPSATRSAEIAVLALIALVTLVFLYDLGNYSSAARLVPSIFIAVTLLLLILRIAVLVVRGGADATPPGAEEEGGDEAPSQDAPAPDKARTLLVLGAVVSYLGVIYLIGLYPAILVYVTIFARLVGAVGWLQSALAGVGTALAAYLIFDVVLGLARLNGVLF